MNETADYTRAWHCLRRLVGLPDESPDGGRDLLERVKMLRDAEEERDRLLDALAGERERCARVPERMAYQRAQMIAAFDDQAMLALARLRCEEDIEVANAIRALGGSQP